MTDHQPDTPQPETGWLIERWINNKLHYWNAGALGHERRDGFTDLVDYAVRFASEKDATTVLYRVCAGQGRVAQHTWVDGDYCDLTDEHVERIKALVPEKEYADLKVVSGPAW